MQIEPWKRAKWRAYAVSWLSDYRFFLRICPGLKDCPEAKVCKWDAQDIQEALDKNDFTSVCDHWPLYWNHLHRLGEKTLFYET